MTWRIGAFILFGLLATVSGVGLYDNMRNRLRIEMLTGDRDALAKTLAAVNQNLGTCHANYRLVELALDRQGKEIRDLASATESAGKRAEQAARDGKAARDAALQASQRVQAIPRPEPDRACQAASEILRGFAP